ncbi:MAG TPA: hypothetical protein DHW02_25165, partial [Ktedonobacter sp.]|nr:hypothetical protein [Ktedonobacter sp.]
MELTLSRTGDHLVLVTCDGHDSHTFDLLSLRADLNKQPPLLVDPISSGKLLFHALFAPETPACAALMASPSRILLVPGDDLLDALPWEYAYGPDGFLVCDVPFVRGLPQQRHRPPVLDQPLHIVAIPSHPLEKDLPPLDIDGEWMRLRKTIQELPYQMTLERTRPPTIERVRNLVANQHHRVIHFMGHGGQDEKAGAFLCFEAENGKLAAVTAKQFALRVRGTAFLVTLNACVSATPGETRFSNLASALVQQHVPYALGMRFSIHDDDARLFSRTFYGDLARGVPVEEALLQARLSLSESERAWVVGVPVLYTSLDAAAPGFTCIAGTPTIDEHQPPMDVIRLPRAEGTFQGRIDEIQQLGTLLTSDSPPRLLTIHGAGGQGKTALAREAVERFAHAWPGGVFATTLETLPEPDVFLTDMARFLAIDPNTKNLERDVLHRLEEQRTLIVLDNAETLVESVNANNEPATNLAQFLRERIVSTQSCFLVTSRDFLGWPGEVGLKSENGKEHDLDGLQPDEGAHLFQQSAPQRGSDIELAQAERLSHQVAGHPLSLRLLGGAFNQLAPLSLSAFIADCETHLLEAENKYVGQNHRHRTLYACIETSVRYLEPELAQLFGKLWLFHAPFLASTAVDVFNPTSDEATKSTSPVAQHLYALWQRSLLTREQETLREGNVVFYRVLPTLRPYIEHYLADPSEREALETRFGLVLASLVRYLYEELDKGSIAVFLATLLRDDIERAVSLLSEETRGYYLLRWGWVLQRLGNRQRGLEFTERAYEIGQESDQQLMLAALNNMATVYQRMGQTSRALELFEQGLLLLREEGDHAGEAAMLNNMAAVYQRMGQTSRAL